MTRKGTFTLLRRGEEMTLTMGTAVWWEAERNSRISVWKWTDTYDDRRTGNNARNTLSSWKQLMNVNIDLHQICNQTISKCFSTFLWARVQRASITIVVKLYIMLSSYFSSSEKKLKVFFSLSSVCLLMMDSFVIWCCDLSSRCPSCNWGTRIAPHIGGELSHGIISGVCNSKFFTAYSSTVLFYYYVFFFWLAETH